MGTITLQIPDGIKPTTELKKRCQLAILPELAESHALDICGKHFNQNFKLGKYNSRGFDLISEDGSIIVEVKQTSRPNSSRGDILQIGSTFNKRNICTHMLILDYYNLPNRCSIIPHDDFFESKFHGITKQWRWDIDYGTRMKGNTSLFLENEVKIN